MQSKTIEDALEKVKHMGYKSLMLVSELTVENLDTISDNDSCLCVLDLDSNEENIKHVPRLVSKMKRTKVLVVGSKDKDWYFGDKHLYYPVVEESA